MWSKLVEILNPYEALSEPKGCMSGKRGGFVGCAIKFGFAIVRIGFLAIAMLAVFAGLDSYITCSLIGLAAVMWYVTGLAESCIE